MVMGEGRAEILYKLKKKKIRKKFGSGEDFIGSKCNWLKFFQTKIYTYFCLWRTRSLPDKFTSKTKQILASICSSTTYYIFQNLCFSQIIGGGVKTKFVKHLNIKHKLVLQKLLKCCCSTHEIVLYALLKGVTDIPKMLLRASLKGCFMDS